MTDVIVAENLEFGYDDRPVIESVSLRIKSGDFIGLIGPNGSGKTTLLQLLLGLLTPGSGNIHLFGAPIDQFDDGERIGYVPQSAANVDRSIPITVREVVRMGRYPHVGLNPLDATDDACIDEALETVGITELADRQIGQLSGGQTQRTFIARALAAEADLLALDEPTVGLDSDARDDFYALLDELSNQGITIILIEHDLSTVTEHADRIICINRRIHYDGNPEGLLEGDALLHAFGGMTPVPGVGN